ncbi:TIGR01777 family oxidoreductase [Janibacter sp. YIM B02568]|uniref:TIGR01777 family oxidoreductase n=1 Tax=Janibacter endophyticus TaxID=2806261 RepID=UPI0019520797|nr:TIGR01777 family oxidoreductase [Janibacter endophyticus]MBM6546168.1 TIGR01777 family oxidoreductase [Janibacter endophyticus]
MTHRERVAVAGSSGLIGSALSASLRARGTEVIRLVRRAPTSPDERAWDPAKGELDPSVLDRVDAVITLAGAGVGDRRWSPSYKQEILASRVDSTRTFAAAAAAAGVPRMVAGSAIGIYGDRGDEVLTEASAPGTGFLVEVVRAWEEAADPAREAGVAVAHARTGLVAARQGGAMEPILRLARLGLGGPLGSGRQWWPLLSLDDEVAALTWLVDHDVTGPVNLAPPQPVRQRDLARELGRQLHRPALLPAPAPAMRLAIGEFAGEVLASTRVLPHVLLDHGFEWQQPDLPSLVRWLLA